VTRERLLSTGEAARELGVHPATLARWWQQGLVEPEHVTAGGHARWYLSSLKQQLRDRREQ
jgi:DNA-binding transcriptional MerR regulator